MSNGNIIKIALETIELEGQSVLGLKKFIDSNFENAVNIIHQAKGRVVITGIGKSAIIAQKIAATFNS
ncbi:MAG TPA: D-arabinose 5-phosphate isomerase, partial [Chitinophagaceae bacterium]|nr:D-arabinose 5-phosphate isomerase [Chitinophagaceae bacterium]